MKKRIIVLLLIACLIASGGIVFMCLDNDDDHKVADSAGRSGSPAVSEDKDYSADPYERAEQIKEDNPEAESEGYIVTLTEEAGDDVVQAIENAAADGAGITKLEYTDRTYRCESLEEFKALAGARYVKNAEPDFKVYISNETGISWTKPNDSFYDNQYNIKNMKVPEVWASGLEGQDVDKANDADGDGENTDDIIVAVIDTGLFAGHDDIDGTRIVEGGNFVPGSSYAGDENGHGTMVSGIIAARKDNGQGIAGLLQGVKIMPLKVFDASGSGYTSAIVDAINCAVDKKRNGVNVAVINMSLGGPGESSSLKAACDAAMQEGIIVVSAAGNDYNKSGREANYPAQYTMGVGSIDSNNNVSAFSQRWSIDDGYGYERKVWVTAPGEGIYGLSHLSSSQYRISSGTSFACPEVAALAALCKSIDNSMDQTQFMALLKDTAIPVRAGVQDEAYGWGRVDFSKTVDALQLDASGTSEVSVSVKNKAGTEISGASVTIRDSSDNTVAPGTNGKWTVNKGAKYKLCVSADPNYESSESEFVPRLDSTALTTTLNGKKAYAVSLDVKDNKGQTVPANEYTISVVNASGTGRYNPDSNGAYHLKVGWYKIKLSSERYYIDGDNLFSVDDIKDDLSGGLTVDVTIRKDAVGLKWNDHSGSARESTASLVEIVNSNSQRSYNVSDGRDQYQICGITVNDLFDEIMDMDESIVSVTIDGKRLVSYSSTDAGAAGDESEDEVRAPAEDPSEETPPDEDETAEPAAEESSAGDEADGDKADVDAADEAGDDADAAVGAAAATSDESAAEEESEVKAASYVLEDASVTLTGKDIEKAIIAIVNDPYGHNDIMDEYNSMRLVIDGRSGSDWLYAPSKITITTNAYLNNASVSGVYDMPYTGYAITPRPVVRYGSSVLREGTDYTVSYQNNVNVGTASVVIIGKGRYVGVQVCTFAIMQRWIAPNIVLSSSALTWNNKSQVPSVAVYDGGYRLPASQYTVSYSGGSKNIGTYSVTVHLRGNYGGIGAVTYSIVPKGTSVSKLTKAKKAVTVKWKKQATKMNGGYITGYQIQASTDPRFASNVKTVNVKSCKSTSKKVGGLKAKKKYYVRVRTYKSVGGRTYCSGWSGVKSVTTK